MWVCDKDGTKNQVYWWNVRKIKNLSAKVRKSEEWDHCVHQEHQLSQCVCVCACAFVCGCVRVRAIHYHIKEALCPQLYFLPRLLLSAHSDTAGEYKSFPLGRSPKGLTIQSQTHRTQTMVLSKCEKIKSLPPPCHFTTHLQLYFSRRDNQRSTFLPNPQR